MVVRMSNMVGGSGGREFVTHLHNKGEQIREIRIAAGDFVDAFQILFTNALGQPDALPKAGGDGGQVTTFVLDEDEYIMGISGRYGDFIDQLQFHTNKRSSPTYGGHGGEVFALYANDGDEVAGLFGRAGWFIDSIGIVTRPVEMPESSKPLIREVKPKELQKIEGIGPKISQILVDNGVVDLVVLAETKATRLRDILKEAGSRYRLADPTTWPEQARIGAAEGLKALQAFQETLKGGRKK